MVWSFIQYNLLRSNKEVRKEQLNHVTMIKNVPFHAAVMFKFNNNNNIYIIMNLLWLMK